jgi:hypothetical protein
MVTIIIISLLLITAVVVFKASKTKNEQNSHVEDLAPESTPALSTIKEYTEAAKKSAKKSTTKKPATKKPAVKKTTKK